MKIRLLLITMFVLFVAANLQAQWFLDAQVGYVMSSNFGESKLHYNRTIDEDYYHDVEPQITEEKIRFSVYDTYAYGMSGGYKLANLEFNLAVLFTSNTSNTNLKYNQIKIQHTTFNPLNGNAAVKNENRLFYNKSWIVSPGVKYNFCLGQIIISPFTYFTFQYTSLIEHNNRSYVADFFDIHAEEAVYREYKYTPDKNLFDLFNPEAGIQIEYLITPQFSVWINSSVTFLKKHYTYQQRSLIKEEITENGEFFEENYSNPDVPEFTADLSNIKTNFGIRYYFKNNKE